LGVASDVHEAKVVGGVTGDLKERDDKLVEGVGRVRRSDQERNWRRTW